MKKEKNNHWLPYNKDLLPLAKELRYGNNLSEVLFWHKVKNGRFLGLDFHRQKVIGNYIVDFYCKSCNVVIEIDGFSHKIKGEDDTIRDEYLRSLGLKVIRLQVRDIMQNLDKIIAELSNDEVFKR